MFSVKFDPKVQKKLNKMGKAMGKAMIMTMNDTALVASTVQRKYLRKHMILRTKWTEGSIFPKRGKRLGLIPGHKIDMNKVFARTGSIQAYMEKQEEGWTARDPEVPTVKSRIGRNRRRKITRKKWLKKLKSQPAWSPSRFTKVAKEDRVKVMIAILKKSRFKGLIHVKKKGYQLPPGYYKMRNRRSLEMLRFSQKTKKRKASHWHTISMRKRVIFARQQTHFNKNAAILLKRYGIK